MEPENPKLGLAAKAKVFADAVSPISKHPILLNRQVQVQKVLNAAPYLRATPEQMAQLTAHANKLKNMARFGNTANAFGSMVYADKLAESKSKKEALDAILGMMVGGLPSAVIGAGLASPRYNSLLRALRGEPEWI